MSDEFMGAQERRFPPMTLALLILNVAAYLAYEWVVTHTNIPLNKYLPLSRQGLQHGYLWQLLTFQFMHAPLEHGLTLEALRHFDIPWHLLLNCWGIFVFGPPVELTVRKRNFVALYLLSGVVGGLLQIFGSILTHRLGGPVVGASAGLFGLIAAFTTLYPDTRMTVLLFLVIPIRMTANRLLTVAAVITAIGMIIPFGNIAHAAHLGGLLTGLIYVRLKMRRLQML